MFLPAVESSQLIIPLGRQMLEQSAAMLAEVNAELDLPREFGVAVNVSPAQLRQPGFAELALSALQRHAVSPSQLSIEITETAPTGGGGCVRRELLVLRDAGVHLALDDYGVGFSALSRLLELPLSALKLDRSLVAGLPDDGRSTAIARSTFALAQDMGIDVVCEGIENEPQRRTLLALGAIYGQGWLYGQPMDTRSLLEHLRRDRDRDEIGALPAQRTTKEGRRTHDWADLLQDIARGRLDVILETCDGVRVAVTSCESGPALGGPHQLERVRRCLTPRERDVLDRVLAGARTAQIATDLGVAKNTVAQHLQAIRRKHGVRSTRALVAALTANEPDTPGAGSNSQ